jgi:26S proteasome regulatory subunit T5
MSTLEDLDDLEREDQDKKKQQQGDGGDGKKPDGDADADMQDADADNEKDEADELLDEELLRSSTRDIVKRRRMLENELRIMRSEFQRLTHEQNTMKEKVKDNLEKIENNRYYFSS